jgi:YYY domain-containing protein
MSDLFTLLKVYIVLQLLGLAGWPWLAIVFGLSWKTRASARDENDWPSGLAFGLGKSLGLVLVAYATWLAAFVALPFSGWGAWIMWLAIGAAGWAALAIHPRTILHLLRDHRRAIVVGEALFLTVFLALCWVRAKTPDATFRYDVGRRDYDCSASEKFTNLALMTGLNRERNFPPRDTWLAGYPLNYYYFGQFEWTMVCKMAGIPPRVGFNLGQAALFALIALNAYSLVLLLTRRIWAGLLAAYAVPIMGSPYGFIQLFTQGLQRYEYWEASRIVEGTIINGSPAGPITEFPFFTFLVGDFHAHGISFHSYLLALAVVVVVRLKGREGEGRADWRKGIEWVKGISISSIVGVALLGLLVAVTAMTNTWDAPSLGLLILIVLALRLIAQTGIRWKSILVALLLAALVAVLARIFLIPYLMTFEVPIGVKRDPHAFYIGPAKWLGTTHLSQFKDYMVHFGFFAIPLTLALQLRLLRVIRGTSNRRVLRLWQFGLVLAVIAFIFAQRYFLLFFLAAMIVSCILVAWFELRTNENTCSDRPGRDSGVLIPSGLAGVAFLLSLAAELWVVDDGYEGAYERYNTVFKLYNIIWLLYAVSFATVMAAMLPRLIYWRDLFDRRKSWPWWAVAVILAMGAAYPIAGTQARLREQRQRTRTRERVALPPGSRFDAIRYYASVDRDEYRVIEWMEQNLRGKPVVAEGCAAEDAYTLQGRSATFTGVRTVLAWPQHEANWRGLVVPTGGGKPVPVWNEMSRRIRDLNLLYTSANTSLIRKIVDFNSIDYILIGRWETYLYGPDAGKTLEQIYVPVFQQRDVLLLKTATGIDATSYE